MIIDNAIIDPDRLDIKINHPVETREYVLKFRYDAVYAILKIREAELLTIKGPCSNTRCPLHYAHSGPCDVK